MEDIDRILEKPMKGSVIINNNQSKLWQLVDFEKNVHSISFENEIYEKNLMLGWDELCSFYKMKANHSLYFRYLGEEEENFIFNITLFKQEQVTEVPQEPTKPGHKEQATPSATKLKSPTQSFVLQIIQWEVILTKYKTFDSQLVSSSLILYNNHSIFNLSNFSLIT